MCFRCRKSEGPDNFGKPRAFWVAVLKVSAAAVYVDCNSFGPRAIEAAVSLYGAERIVCGTDGTEFGCDWTRKALADAQIGEAARAQILHHNAAAMLARVAKSATPGRAVA